MPTGLTSPLQLGPGCHVLENPQGLMALHHPIILADLPQPQGALTSLLPLPGWPILHPVLVTGHIAVLVSSLSSLQGRAKPEAPATSLRAPASNL